MLLPALPTKLNTKSHLHDAPDRRSDCVSTAMTSHLGTKGASLDHDQLERGLRAHREEVRRWGQRDATPRMA